MDKYTLERDGQIDFYKVFCPVSSQIWILMIFWLITMTVF